MSVIPESETRLRMRDLLKLLESRQGTWLPRRTIASALGDKELSMWDRAILDTLAELRIVERRENKRPHVASQWEYRFVGLDDDSGGYIMEALKRILKAEG